MANRSASFSYKDRDIGFRTIGSDLGVKYILAGSVSGAADRVKITVRMVHAKSGIEQWSEDFDVALDDIHTVQSEIVAAFADQLLDEGTAAALQPHEPATASNDAYIFYWRAVEYLRRPREEVNLTNAVALFERALEHDPRYAQAYAGLCEAHLALHIVSRAVQYFEDAERNCHRALTLDRSSPDVHVALGVLYRESGQHDESEQALKFALESEPDHVDAIIELGETYAAAKRPDEAEYFLRRAVALKPGYWSAHSALGDFLYKQKDYAGATRHFGRVTELTPDSARGHSNLAAAKYMLEDLDGALVHWRQSVELEPTRLAYTNLGLRYYYLGRFADAAEMQRKAIELAEEDHRLWGRLAESYRFVEGKADEASAAYRRAIELAQDDLRRDPSEWSTVSLLALYHAHAGNDEDAIALIEQAHQLSPDNSEIYYYAALISQVLGQPDRVLQNLEKTLDLGFPGRLVATDPDLQKLSDDPDVGPFLRSLAADPN